MSSAKGYETGSRNVLQTSASPNSDVHLVTGEPPQALATLLRKPVAESSSPRLPLAFRV